MAGTSLLTTTRDKIVHAISFLQLRFRYKFRRWARLQGRLSWLADQGMYCIDHLTTTYRSRVRDQFEYNIRMEEVEDYCHNCTAARKTLGSILCPGSASVLKPLHAQLLQICRHQGCGQLAHLDGILLVEQPSSVKSVGWWPSFLCTTFVSLTLHSYRIDSSGDEIAFAH